MMFIQFWFCLDVLTAPMMCFHMEEMSSTVAWRWNFLSSHEARLNSDRFWWCSSSTGSVWILWPLLRYSTWRCPHLWHGDEFSFPLMKRDLMVIGFDDVHQVLVPFCQHWRYTFYITVTALTVCLIHGKFRSTYDDWWGQSKICGFTLWRWCPGMSSSTGICHS